MARRITLLAVALAAIPIFAFVLFESKQAEDQRLDAAGTPPCGSCDAHHQNLSRLRALQRTDRGENE